MVQSTLIFFKVKLPCEWVRYEVKNPVPFLRYRMSLKKSGMKKQGIIFV
jgi:hypothetical protein